ncbi:MAG: cyclodeaminase/cyclohydrolase family protein [Stomatobaculum sp.]|nr:cyclodeaminase/cyclohydrolase family protein [Stomatobaculum sp.]
MDETAAREAGVCFVFASYGFGKASCPDAVIRSLAELPDVLTGLFGAGLLGKSSADFTALLASSSAVPGGGGASALAGAIGAALGDMVGELTIGKKKYADVEEEIKAAMTEARSLRVRLLSCVEKDAAAFEPLSKAYGIPKDDPDRNRIMEACLKDAAAVPLEIFDLCCEAISIQNIFAEKGSRLMISDAATGAALCRGALYGAAINVKVNTRLMKDRDYAEQLDRHIEDNLEKYAALAQEIFQSVVNKLS